jgi:8-amino-3,8-dideoxy-alpha-D-manno-octulosonate transaminase
MPGFELFGDLERKEAQEVLETGVLMRYGFEGMRKGRWKALEMEKALAKRMGVRHAQLVSSGTAALTVALASAGIGAGDEVIVPTFTFVASYEAILAVGAVPVPADIDNTLTLDTQAVSNRIGNRTKAVMPVHMCGSMADLKALKTLCKKHHLLLIEDACQAIGGSYEGKPLGSYGDLGCFSFDYVKTITCGEGGAVITDNDEFYRNADHYSDHGHDHQGSDRGAEGHPFAGYNYRISELNAAIGLAQLRRLDDFLDLQETNYSALRAGLENISAIQFRRVPVGGVENYSFLSFFMPDEVRARQAQKALTAAGVDGCFYWYDNNWHYHRQWDHFKEGRTLGPLSASVKQGFERMEKNIYGASDHWMGRTISLLIKMGWKREEVEQRAETIARVLTKIL